MQTAIYCVAENSVQADEIIQELKTSGVSNDSISLLFPERAKSLEKDKSIKRGLNWLAGVYDIERLAVVPLFVPHMMVAALGFEIAATAQETGVSGALLGMGIPESRTDAFQEKLEKGEIVISVKVESEESKDYVVSIFKRAKVREILSGS
jgi:hypothetical protein